MASNPTHTAAVVPTPAAPNPSLKHTRTPSPAPTSTPTHTPGPLKRAKPLASLPPRDPDDGLETGGEDDFDLSLAVHGLGTAGRLKGGMHGGAVRREEHEDEEDRLSEPGSQERHEDELVEEELVLTRLVPTQSGSNTQRSTPSSDGSFLVFDIFSPNKINRKAPNRESRKAFGLQVSSPPPRPLTPGYTASSFDWTPRDTLGGG